MTDKYAFMREALAHLEEEGRMINIRTIESPADAWMVVDGKKVLNFCTNNYLGLANRSEIKTAAKHAVDEWGAGPAAVRTIAGTELLHLQSVEAALLVQSGFCANQAAIPPLVGRDRETDEQDVLFSDRLNHASIIDGARLSGAKIVVYEHCDPDDLEAKIVEQLPNYRRGLVVTDGVFSMDGDVAPLDRIYEVAERHGVLTMVDDAHGEGVLGRGRGIVSHFGLEGKFDVEIGTMSKAFGVMGGVVAGSQLVVDYIRQQARPNLFSSALTPADTGACLAAVEYVEQHPELVDQLWDNANYFKAGITDLGLDTGRTQTPIVPVMLGDVKLAKEFSARLFEHSVFAMALGFPTVPRGQARIRVMNTAAHTQQDLDFGLAAFKRVAQELGVI
jgi:glycine C-acetyltransferase